MSNSTSTIYNNNTYSLPIIQSEYGTYQISQFFVPLGSPIFDCLNPNVIILRIETSLGTYIVQNVFKSNGAIQIIEDDDESDNVPLIERINPPTYSTVQRLDNSSSSSTDSNSNIFLQEYQRVSENLPEEARPRPSSIRPRPVENSVVEPPSQRRRPMNLDFSTIQCDYCPRQICVMRMPEHMNRSHQSQVDEWARRHKKCPYCDEVHIRTENMKIHIRSAHTREQFQEWTNRRRINN